MAESTFNQGYRVGAAKTDVDYATAYNASTGTMSENPAGLLCEQQIVFPSGSYKRTNIYRAFLYWATSALTAAAIITGVELQIRVTNKWTQGRSFKVVVQNGQPTYPHNPAVEGDYLRTHYSGNGGEISSDDITVGAWNTISLNEDGLEWINKEGWTKLVLRIDKEIDGDAPTTPSEGEDNAEGIQMAIIDGVCAKLVITFTTAEVTTEAVSEKGIDHAKGNGTASGDDITERGFEVKLSFAGTLYGYIEHSVAGFEGDVNLSGTAWVGTLVKTVSETGTFSAESFTGDLGRFPIAVSSDKLFAGESYTYRARATIGGTVYYGDWVAFTMNSYPAGGGPDDQIPIEDIIPMEPPIVPYEPPEDIIDPDFPPIDLPEFEWPDFDYPDIPPYNGSWISWFYYRKAYTKRDLDDLRRKCRIFQDNSVEYALVINHNSRVLQQFLNSMTVYLNADEHNTFRPIIPPQYLNELARKPLDVIDFREMINNFISNSIDNTNNVNNNFRLIRDGLGDYTYTEDEGFIEIAITTRLVNDNNPDVESLKKVIDRLNREMASNYRIINHNLHVLRSILI